MLTLIGTAHFDINGYNRLGKLLQKFNPDIIGIEETKEDSIETSDLVRRLTDKKTFLEALKNLQKKFPDSNPETLKLWLSSVNYEQRAVDDHSASKNIPVFYCDNPQVLADVDFKGEAENPKSPLNVKLGRILRLLPEELKSEIDREYSLTAYPVNDNPQLVRFYQERDRFTEALLRRQMGWVVYVCGLDHIFGDYHPNLFDRLNDLNPQRIKLNEADKL